MSTQKTAAKKWKINKLKEHPQQAAVFGDVSDEELAALAANMEKHGLRDPVEILSDGTIIAGHQRVRAAKRLGWKEIDVVIRADLEAAGPAAVEAYFVESNFVRRQLSPLGRARCLKRLMEIEAGRQADRFGDRQKEALKARIAQRMRLSARSVSRYLLILSTPAGVQRAFDRGEVSLINAGKVALLDRAAQAEIARRIEAGGRAANVVKEHLAQSGSGAGDDPGRSFVRLVAALRREAPQLTGRVGEINRGRLKKSLGTLREAEGVLAQLLERAARRHPDG